MNPDPTPQESRRTSRPIVRGTLNLETVQPHDGLANQGPLIRVNRPVTRGILKLVPVLGTHIELTLPISSEGDGKRKFELLNMAIRKLNELEAMFDRPGVCVIDGESGLREGKVVLFLAPHEATDAIETCKRLADCIFATVRTLAGAAIRVLSADSPSKPLYELAV
jgi:hypothetical protein